MDYDDDLTTSGRYPRPQRGVAGNGRSAPPPSYRGHSLADRQLEQLEADAYIAVVRAFAGQAESITWAKETVLSTLRTELHVTEEQHKSFCMRVHSDDSLRQIRERRATGDTGFAANQLPPPMDTSPGTVGGSQSRKKARTGPPPPAPVARPLAMQAPKASILDIPGPPSSITKTRSAVKSSKSKQKRPHGRGGHAADVSAAAASNMEINPLVGKRLKMVWNENGTQKWYDGVVSDYNPAKGEHSIIYDFGTDHESFEWVNLDEVPEDELMWVEGPPMVDLPMGPGARLGASKPAGVRGRGPLKRGQSATASARPAGTPASARTPGGFAKAGTPAGVNGAGKRTLRAADLPPLEDLLPVDRIEEEEDVHKLEEYRQIVKEREDAITHALQELGSTSDEEEEEEEDARGGNLSFHRDGRDSSAEHGGSYGDEQAEHEDARGRHLESEAEAEADRDDSEEEGDED
eukprot:jgi/Mesen1/9627/ME000669S09066